MTVQPNPFSTRFIAPGKLEFCERDVMELVRKLLQSRSPMQIVGAHGSGKTTLTRSLARELAGLGWQSSWAILDRSGLRRLERPENTYPRGETKARKHLMVVDGIERLGLLSRALMLANLKRRYDAVVVTTHRRRLFMPMLATTEMDITLFLRLCDRLVEGTSLNSPEWRTAFANVYRSHAPNAREAFLELYDLVDNRGSELLGKLGRLPANGDQLEQHVHRIV